MINRIINPQIKDKLFKKKAIILLGARQTGKSTLINEILRNQEKDVFYFNGDDFTDRETLKNISASQIKDLIKNKKIIFIDEAQRIFNIGLTLKIIVDNFKDKQVIATGSSSFDLISEINETLPGRKFEFTLFPLSYKELVDNSNILDEKKKLNHRLIYGSYPEVVTNPEISIDILKTLIDGVIYKDVINFGIIKKPELLEKILRALAHQIGNEVNFNEISQLLNSDPKTIESYIDLLEKSFIIFRLKAFGGNQRNEIKKGKKIYFFDNGVRNAFINDFRVLDNRIDVGHLWENYIISERLKVLKYNKISCRYFFWRNTQQQEIDYIEEYNDKLYAYEFKWNKNSKKIFSKSFTGNYSVSSTEIISPENMSKFLLI